MCSDPRESYEEKAAHYLDSVGNIYVLNESSGLYEPEPKHSEEKGNAKTAKASKKSPIFVNILRDWVAIGISAFTVILLGATVFYAKKQWAEMNSTLGEMQKQTGFAQISAADATQNTKNTEEFFKTDERAWVVVDEVAILKTYPADANFPPNFKYGLYAKNAGKTVARDVHIHIDSFFGTSPLGKNGIERTQMRTWRGRNGKPFGPDKSGPQSLAPGERSTVPVIAGGQAPRDYWTDTLVGRIDYIDAFGVHHWKTFCYTVTDENGSLGHCISGNDEDNNPETRVEKKK